MVIKWLHIDTHVGDPWILPIWDAVNNAIKSNLVAPLSQDMRELGLHISTRLDILPCVILRLNAGANELYKVARNYGEEYIFTKESEGYALPMRKKRDLIFSLIADIDSLFFEFNSVSELITKFFERLYSHVGNNLKKGEAGIKIKKIVESAGHDSRWFQALDSHRNFFIHEGAPYFAIDVSLAPQNYDLLIMKENLRIFEDGSKFIRLSDLSNIVKGFLLARYTIQKHLIELFQKLGS